MWSPPDDEVDSATPARSFLVVRVGDHRCGLPVEAVVEIHPAVALTPLPDAPEVIVGLVNRRGSALPVLSLRRRLGLPLPALQSSDCLVVLTLPYGPVALLVDAAVDMLTIAADDISENTPASAQAAYTRGVAVLPDGLMAIVDLEAFLRPDEAAALEQALDRSES